MGDSPRKIIVCFGSRQTPSILSQPDDHRPLTIRLTHRPPLQPIFGGAAAMDQTITPHGTAAGIGDSGRVQQRQQSLLLLTGFNNLDLHRRPIFIHTSTTITQT